jgi:hypothetical protein
MPGMTGRLLLITGAACALRAARVDEMSGARIRRMFAVNVFGAFTIGLAGDVAAAALWLLSNEAAYTTGALLDVAGGR